MILTVLGRIPRYFHLDRCSEEAVILTVSIQGEYDFIHGRNLLAAIKDIPALFNEIFKALKPGAYVEMGEFESAFLSDDNSIPADWPPVKCTELLQEALGKLGKRFWTGPEIADFMTAAGFVDVEVRRFRPCKPPTVGCTDTTIGCEDEAAVRTMGKGQAVETGGDAGAVAE